jgi:hypothetical protein
MDGCKTFAILEQARLRRHFRMVAAELRASDISELTVEQRAARAALLDEVERYGHRGRFPKNRHTPDAMAPTFIDEDGTRCAVAHLLEATGASVLAARIARTHNTALVPELRFNRELLAWIEQVGLTIREAARIQPSYCSGTKASHCVCYAVDNVTGVVEGTITVVGTSPRVRIDAVHGDVGSLVVGGMVDVRNVQPNQEYLMFAAGDVLVFGLQFANSAHQTPPMRIRGDGLVDVTCSMFSRVVAVPELTGEDAVAALVASTRGQEECVETLERVDSTWGLPPCEHPSPGCSVSGGAEPLVAGGALLAATLRGRVRAGRKRVAG